MADPNETGSPTIVNPDGSFIENYLDTMVKDPENEEAKLNLFNEETRTDQTIRNLKGLPATFDMIRNTQKLVGKDKIAIPGEDATDEERDVVMKALGWPDDAEGLGLEMLDVENPDTELFDFFKATCHKLRLLPGQAKGFFNEITGFIDKRAKKRTDDFQLELETGMDEMRGKLGAAYKEKREGISNVINTITQGLKDPEDMIDRLENDADKDPRIFGLLLNLVGMISEDRLRAGGKRTSFTMTPDEAKAQINEIRGNPKHPYFIRGHAQHKEAVEKMDRLTRISMGQAV